MSSATWRFAAIAAAIAAIVFTHAAVRGRAQAGLQAIATGLVNPRGLNFGPEGALYVADAGSGGTRPSIVHSNNHLVCHASTAAITRTSLSNPPSHTRGLTRLSSLAEP